MPGMRKHRVAMWWLGPRRRRSSGGRYAPGPTARARSGCHLTQRRRQRVPRTPLDLHCAAIGVMPILGWHCWSRAMALPHRARPGNRHDGTQHALSGTIRSGKRSLATRDNAPRDHNAEQLVSVSSVPRPGRTADSGVFLLVVLLQWRPEAVGQWRSGARNPVAARLAGLVGSGAMNK